MPLGFHVSKNKRTMINALTEDIRKLNDFDPCAQIFIMGPRNSATISKDDIVAITEFTASNKIPIVAHSAYINNPWGGGSVAIPNINKELMLCNVMGLEGLVVHLGKTSSDYNTMARILKDLKGKKLYFEIHAAKQPFTFETTEKLNDLFRTINMCDTSIDNIGLCIDTAHLFSSGTSLEKAHIAKKFIAELPNVDIMLHLNDSASALGSGIDKHAGLTHGHIWGTGDNSKIEKSGLKVILDWADENNIITILERDEEYLNRDLNLIKGLGYFTK